MFKYPGVLIVVLLVIGVSSCRKKPPLPPPPPKAAPTAADSVPTTAPAKPDIRSFAVSPERIVQGQSSRLTWLVVGAEDVEISNGIGGVSAAGDREVSPGDTTEYVLKAMGPGGEVTQSVRLTVMPSPQPVGVTRTPGATLSERLAREVSDIHFGYDRNTLDTEAIATLQRNAEVLRRILQDFPDAEIIMEGHCDERGSAEYNLGLGDRRASAAREYLHRLGLNTNRLRTVSLGKERPQCTEATEDCWRRNRRVHFTTAD